MLIHKDEIHKSTLPNYFLSLICSAEGSSTYFWIKNILEQSPKIKIFHNVLQSSTVFHSGMFYKVLFYLFIYLFIHNFMTTYTYKYMHVPMDWTEELPIFVLSIGTCIYVYVYVVMKL